MKPQEFVWGGDWGYRQVRTTLGTWMATTRGGWLERELPRKGSPAHTAGSP